MIQRRNIILKRYVINSLIYKLSICWICSSYILHKKLNKILQEPDWPFVSFWNLKSLYFIYSLSFVVPLPVIRCHSLSLVITRCHSPSLVVFRCHSLPLDLSLVVIRCHSLSFVVPLVAFVCYSLPFVITRCRSMHHSPIFL